MPKTKAAWIAGRLRELNVKEEDGVIVVEGRASRGIRQFFGQNNLPVIMGSTRVAFLVMLEAEIMLLKTSHSLIHAISLDCQCPKAS